SSEAGAAGAASPVDETSTAGASSCSASAPLAGATARPAGRGLAFTLPERAGAVDVQVFAQTADHSRRVAHFRSRRGGLVRPARGLRDGVYVVRFGGSVDVRRV